MHYFSHLKEVKFGLMFAKVPYSLKLGLALSRNMAPQPPCLWQPHIPRFGRSAYSFAPPDLQFSGTRLWKTESVIKTSILGPISSFAKWGWPITHTRALVYGGTSVHWSCHPFPETLPPAHTTPHTVHKRWLGTEGKSNLVFGGEVTTWHLSPKCCLFLVFVVFGNTLCSLPVQGVWLKENACHVMTKGLAQQPCPKLQQNKSCAINKG